MKKFQFTFLQGVFFPFSLIKRRLVQICLFSLLCGLALGASDASAWVNVFVASVSHNSGALGAEPQRVVPQTGRAGGNGKSCRAELSVFYHGMQSLGDVWGRSACERPLSPSAIADMRAALTDTVHALGMFPAGCIPFDVGRIRSLSDRLPSLGDQLPQEVLSIIQDLQRALAGAHF